MVVTILTQLHPPWADKSQVSVGKVEGLLTNKWELQQYIIKMMYHYLWPQGLKSSKIVIGDHR